MVALSPQRSEIGINYHRYAAILYLTEMLINKNIELIRINACMAKSPENGSFIEAFIDDIVIEEKDGTTRFVDVKEKRPKGSIQWTVASLGKERIWERLRKQYEECPSGKFVIFLKNPAPDLENLQKLVTFYHSLEYFEFAKKNGQISKKYLKIFNMLKKKLSYDDAETFKLFRQLQIRHSMRLEIIEELVKGRLQGISCEPEQAIKSLFWFISKGVSKSLIERIEFLNFLERIKKDTESERGGLLPRKEYNRKLIRVLNSEPQSLRAIVMGPHFLHPEWVITREHRDKSESFSLTLHHYLTKVIKDPHKKAFLIIRNSSRYIEYLKSRIRPKRVSDLIPEMMKNLDSLMAPCIKFRCLDTGWFEGLIITEGAVFTYFRETETSPITGGDIDLEKEKIKDFTDAFDRTFCRDYNEKKEVDSLKEFIKSLEKFL